MQTKRLPIKCAFRRHKWEPKRMILKTAKGEPFADISGVKCKKCGLERSGCSNCGKKLYVRDMITRPFADPSMYRCPKCGNINSSYQLGERRFFK